MTIRTVPTGLQGPSPVIKAGLSLLLGLALLFTLSACSKGYDVEFGSNVDGAKNVVITNDTGSNITALEITDDETVTEISKSIVDSTSPWENGKTARVSYTNGDTATILLKAGDKTYIMHNVELSSIEKATLKLDGDFAYLEFEKDGATSCTLEDEKAYVKAEQEKQGAEEKAKAEAEQKAKEEEEAKKKAEEEAAAAQAQTYSYSGGSAQSSSGSSSSSSTSSGSSSSSSSSSSGSGSVQQSTDGCLPALD